MAFEGPAPSQELDRAVDSLSEAFAARSVRHALIGGLATSIRGRPRYTQDVDLLLDVRPIALLDDLVGRGFALDRSVAVREFVQTHITAFSFGAARIDWVKPVLPSPAATAAGAGGRAGAGRRRRAGRPSRARGRA
jgi:hypothetical protein